MFTDVCRPEFLKKLDRLRPRVQEGRGLRPGDTPIPRHNHPSGTEFEAYKDYSPGDDFRHIDWNTVGRLDQLLVRTFTAEREIPFHILLDTSASMGAPAADNKFSFAVGLAAALLLPCASTGVTLYPLWLHRFYATRVAFFACSHSWIALPREERRF
jgi:uncharacterized protein (DUF58 family)